MRNVIHAGDSFAVLVTVQDGEAPLDLTGATLSAAAASGASSVAATVTVIDAAGGVARVFWAPGLIAAGRWAAALRVARGGEAQTVWAAELVALSSPFVAA